MCCYIWGKETSKAGKLHDKHKNYREHTKNLETCVVMFGEKGHQKKANYTTNIKIAENIKKSRDFNLAKQASTRIAKIPSN